MTRRVIPDAELLAQKWYLVIDDLIGGWAIANVDKTTADMNMDGADEDRWLGDCMTEGIGRHVVDLHNAALKSMAEQAKFFATLERPQSDQVDLL